MGDYHPFKKTQNYSELPKEVLEARMSEINSRKKNTRTEKQQDRLGEILKEIAKNKYYRDKIIQKELESKIMEYNRLQGKNLKDEAEEANKEIDGIYKRKSRITVEINSLWEEY